MPLCVDPDCETRTISKLATQPLGSRRLPKVRPSSCGARSYFATSYFFARPCSAVYTGAAEPFPKTKTFVRKITGEGTSSTRADLA